MGVEDLGNLTLIRYERGFAFDRSLETVTMNPVIWPLIKECTADQPRLVSGTLSFQSHDPQIPSANVWRLIPLASTVQERVVIGPPDTRLKTVVSFVTIWSVSFI